MRPDLLHAAGAFAAALALTLVLAAWVTPRHWWRRPTARALLIVAGGTWGMGSLILWLLPAPPLPPAALAALAIPAPAPVVATAPLSAPSVQPIAGQSYRAHHDLNLRAGAGVAAARIGVVPGGAAVTTTGRRDGDWWQIRASVAGREQLGWASSLWLRRAAETAQP